VESTITRLGLVSYVLRFPICTESVLQSIFRTVGLEQIESIRKPASFTELPARLFRDLRPKGRAGVGHKRHPPGQWSSNDDPLPFLRYLYNHPRIPPPDTNTNHGYALTKAVAAGFKPLIRFLLLNGADPSQKGCLAVMVAIRRKELELVKMLIEPSSFGVSSKNDEGGGRSGKRRRMDDRLRVTQKMLASAIQCDARDIANYFVVEKGVTPPIQSLMMM